MNHAAASGMNREARIRVWIEAYADSVLHVCFLYLSDQGQAEDAAQDTWVKAWKHMEDYERGDIVNEKAWLLRIAINTCRDYRRSAWFRHVDRKQALENLPPRVTAVDMEDRSLTLTVMELPDRYKQVILLYYYQGLTLQETADVLGVSQSSVQRRLRKAEALLKSVLAGGEADEG